MPIYEDKGYRFPGWLGVVCGHLLPAHSVHLCDFGPAEYRLAQAQSDRAVAGALDAGRARGARVRIATSLPRSGAGVAAPPRDSHWRRPGSGTRRLQSRRLFVVTLKWAATFFWDLPVLAARLICEHLAFELFSVCWFGLWHGERFLLGCSAGGPHSALRQTPDLRALINEAVSSNTMSEPIEILR